MATATERFLRPRDVEAIFASFVRNANALGKQARTARATFDAGAASFDAEVHTVPETSRPFDLSETVPLDAPDTEEHSTGRLERESWESLVPPPGDDTARHEAVKLVPDVSSVRPPEPSPKEASEDGEMPPRELERLMDDMAVLIRYGHGDEVAARFEQLQREYPRDLLLLRRIAEFHLEQGQEEPAVDCLFRLARQLFERRNVVGMRAALEQILVLRPDEPRAHKLLALLERRSDRPPGG
ncbi:MAG: hypothetical protein JJ863_17420 [Deltaproteobacteria bacterium]|nr:hypothetical protein [Deltaproteobacteria bacterium]